MNWLHLIEAAKLFAGQIGAPTQGRPRQAMLKRAISTAYYALFHALCHSNANTLFGRAAGPPYRLAWVRRYRAIEHRSASQRMNQQVGNMSVVSRNFGAAFIFLQEQRHRADYDPEARFQRSEVISLISRAETAIQTFLAAASERRTLAAIVLLRDR